MQQEENDSHLIENSCSTPALSLCLGAEPNYPRWVRANRAWRRRSLPAAPSEVWRVWKTKVTIPECNFGRVPSFRYLYPPYPTIAWFSLVLVLCRWTWCWSARTFLSAEFQNSSIEFSACRAWSSLPSFEHGSAPHRSSHPWSQAQTPESLQICPVCPVCPSSWMAPTPFLFRSVTFRNKVSFQISQENAIGRSPAWTLQSTMKYISFTPMFAH